MKPLGRIYKEVIEEIKQGKISPQLNNGKAIVIDNTESFKGWKYGEAFAEYLRRGEHVKFVLKNQTTDAEYLAKRGITELLKI